MASVEYDEVREKRIEEEVLVDTDNDKEERAMGWYYYLDDCLNVPFNAIWIKKSRKSPTPQEIEVEVLGMAPEDDCLRDMFVEVAYLNGKEDDVYSAKLSELKVLDADEDTQEAIADWMYWINRGYKF
ncbi:calcium-binding protein [Calothrix sp. 336/3]|uniref:calcium-binding protein n=1 Tax=Calothrix sp. 336/3 TaxID=1337936 RepID=UPI0004E3B1E0|nr:calcium-binding protein [Calothrix sp. 336/3]AKG23842.1 calcium binding protein from Anabaena CcbP [Calothrix sp. 336/3]